MQSGAPLWERNSHWQAGGGPPHTQGLGAAPLQSALADLRPTSAWKNFPPRIGPPRLPAPLLPPLSPRKHPGSPPRDSAPGPPLLPPPPPQPLLLQRLPSVFQPLGRQTVPITKPARLRASHAPVSASPRLCVRGENVCVRARATEREPTVRARHRPPGVAVTEKLLLRGGEAERACRA